MSRSTKDARKEGGEIECLPYIMRERLLDSSLQYACCAAVDINPVGYPGIYSFCLISDSLLEE